ncbi:MAG: diacylglycerol/lipid kinase family protein, partial [Bacteroidia bacterium]
IAKEFFLYKAQDYELLINGKSYNRKAFLITVANAGQYGNDFYIAPQAKMNDGQFHVVVLKPFNLLQALALTVKIMRRKAHESRFTETFTGDSLVIKRQKDGAIHYDGEPEMLGTELSYAIRPGSLRVIVGTNYPSIK